MKTAIVHEWLNEWAGAEQCLGEILEIIPNADVFAIVDFLGDADRQKLRGRQPKTSFIQRMPWARRKLEMYLPMMPIAIEQFDLSEYDLVISSSHAVAKGVITGPDQLHLSYVYSPMRYAWDLQHQYLKLGGLDRGLRGLLARLVFHYLRIWDVRTGSGVDAYACDSVFVSRRVRRWYGRSSKVIYPPVNVHLMPYREDKESFYLAASRLMPYKRVDLIVEAFRQHPDRRLVVIGAGPDLTRMKRVAPSNVTFLGRVSDVVLRDHLSRARAFLFAAQEDFGILPLEAQACGTPVIAFGKGGALETVRGAPCDRPTGLFFNEQTSASVNDAIERFESLSTSIRPSDCRENAVRFSPERFRDEFGAWIQECISNWRDERGAAAGSSGHAPSA